MNAQEIMRDMYDGKIIKSVEAIEKERNDELKAKDSEWQAYQKWLDMPQGRELIKKLEETENFFNKHVLEASRQTTTKPETLGIFLCRYTTVHDLINFIKNNGKS